MHILKIENYSGFSQFQSHTYMYNVRTCTYVQVHCICTCRCVYYNGVDGRAADLSLVKGEVEVANTLLFTNDPDTLIGM